MVADVGAVTDGVTLEVAVDRAVHLVEQDAVVVAGEQVVPRRSPNDLDHVPVRAAEDGLELLDDLAVAPHGTVESLQVAVDDPDQVVELLATGERDRAQRLGLVGLAVAEEAPHARLARVVDLAVVQVLVEASVVDRVDRPEAHRHRGELPEVGHEPRVRVRRQPRAGARQLATEVVEVLFVEPAFDERTGVDAGRGVALEVHVVAGQPVVLAAEEVVETDLVLRGRRRERREVPADAVRLLVGVHDHHRGVPADVGPDSLLDVLVAGEPRLLGRRNGVHVRRAHLGRRAHLSLASALGELAHQIAGPRGSFRVDDGIERIEPFTRLGRIGIGELVNELVDDHARPSWGWLCRVVRPDHDAGTLGHTGGRVTIQGSWDPLAPAPSSTPTVRAAGIPARAAGPGPFPEARSRAARRRRRPISGWRSRPRSRRSAPSTARSKWSATRPTSSTAFVTAGGRAG